VHDNQEECPMNEQQSETTASVMVSNKWGIPIGKERQAELQGYLDRWQAETDHGARRGPFDEGPEKPGVQLTGADVFWLSMRLLAGRFGIGAGEEAIAEAWGRLQKAAERGFFTQEFRLDGLRLEGARLGYADLRGALLWHAHLEGANCWGIHLEDAQLEDANLDGAYLSAAHLERAKLGRTRLAGANLSEAHLEAADMQRAQLSEADLRHAVFDASTRLDFATLAGARVADTRWGGTNLTQVDWRVVPELGDERLANAWRPTKLVEMPPKQRHDYKVAQENQQLDLFEAAVRANRQMAEVLRAQRLDKYADNFAYRAQACERRLLWKQGIQELPEYLWSLLRWLTAGYGYRLPNILATYGVILIVFTLIYWASGVHSFIGESGIQQLWDSFLVSLTAIHGRTTFEQLGAWSFAAWVAAIESVTGILIEGIFVAMLVQRFFAGR
jgi:hypothetical protein